ncbi:probable serine/threonine-protein kinase DDB_G0283337 isoform X3 [Metopolophium dirhodum]|uniref:probable serine/threonine-protein kinase DDB_G0283337 isoform X3 n=1 Tax=Metopolophium dirhodum TaxID=44670 RepID=UPI00298F9BB3|nr:probable serine/threonine-protein kinase DDB_G0283337 isoform X3 [Metopolophium dirhodum]
MSPSNSKLSPNHKTTSCIKNKNGKKKGKMSFLRTSKNDVTDDFYFKRKKSIKHSQVDINNAVLAAPNGCIMTRNKLKKQLTNYSELVETTAIEDKCLKIDNIRSKSKKVFTKEISSPYPGKQLDTYYKKRIPSLFESDSDPEIDYFQIKDSIKNEVEEISTCISYPDDRFYPAFDKNVNMRTYFNKKLYPINNKSDVQSLNTFEKINEEPSSSYYRDKTAHDSNQCKSISQNYSKTSKSLKVTGPTKSVQTNSEGDEYIVVTESFIRQLKNELKITKTQSQGKYNNPATISEEIIDLSNIQTFKCDKSSSDQSIENHPNSEKNITHHLSQDQIEPDQYFHTVIKDEIKNNPKYYNSKGRYNCLLKNDNLSSTNDSYSNKNDLNYKCYCKNFRSFNKDVDKIFTSKIKHFAFNNNAKKLREKILREKHLEANILNMLITKVHKNIIQSSEHIPIFNSISINKKYKKCIDLKENHHIKQDTKTNAVGKINTNTSCILKVADSSKDERTIDCLSSAASIKNFSTDVKICEKNLINPKKKQSSELKFIKVSNPILPKNIKSNPITEENNFVFLQKPNAQKSNSLQKSRIPGIIDSEKETNITLLFEPPQYKNFFDTSPMLPHISENNNNEPVNNSCDVSVDNITFSLNNKSSDDDGNRRLIDPVITM